MEVCTLRAAWQMNTVDQRHNRAERSCHMPTEPPTGKSTPPALATHQLTKRFGDTIAVDHLDLELAPGEIFGFLGSNGAGKSTTLRLLLGQIRPSEGSAAIFGIDVSNIREAHPRLGYVPGDVALWPRFTGAETLELLGNLHGSPDRTRRAEMIERFDLDPSKRCADYSKGNRQKVALIHALSVNADLLLLDEPTTGLDPIMEVTFRECIRERNEAGVTVVLSSHVLSEVESLCTEVGILRRGALVARADITDLRAMRSTQFDIVFDGPMPDLSTVSGVTNVNPIASGVRVSVSGSHAPLIAHLSGSTVLELRTHEASLEEIFLDFYDQP
jgi:ABC-2 type transport system ATP-binding protein